MGPPAAFVPRFGVTHEIPETLPLPANLTIADVTVEPPVARVGERVTIRASIRSASYRRSRYLE